MKKFLQAFLGGLLLVGAVLLVKVLWETDFESLFSNEKILISQEEKENALPPERPANPLTGDNGQPFSVPANARSN